MNATIEEVNSVTRKLTITVPRERVGSELNRAYRNLQGDVQMRGFRPGKVPLSVLEARFRSQVESEVAAKLVNDTLEKTIEENGLFLVSPPSIKPGKLSRKSDFEYAATVEIRPELVAGGYAGLSLTREKHTIDDSMVEAELQELRERRADFVEVEEDRPLRVGDQARIDYTMSVDGKVLDNDGEPRSLHVPIRPDKSSFLPGFVDNVIGMTKGETRSFELEQGKDSPVKAFAGTTVQMTVTLQDIKRSELPKLDDEFAKDLEFDTLDELKTKIRKDLEQNYHRASEIELRHQISEMVIEANPVELPPGLVNQQIDLLAREQLQQIGKKPPKGKITMSEEERAEFEKAAVYRLKLSLIIDSLAKQENLEVSDEELQARYEEIAERTGKRVEAVRGYYMKNESVGELKSQILEDKAFKFIVDSANVTEVAPGAEEDKVPTEEPGVIEPEGAPESEAALEPEEDSEASEA